MNMAKTIMISNDLYDELKKRKGDRSFSEIIKASLEQKKIKTGKDLLPFVGILEGDKEYDEVMDEAKVKWREWREKLEKESA